uniref:Uncharacterized protein n=1 Tax=Timema bartmani TaxID=61472 RepID=A0A7R9EXK0_9NEOP|nr:unnamed protein product [Timema bartmani]
MVLPGVEPATPRSGGRHATNLATVSYNNIATNVSVCGEATDAAIVAEVLNNSIQAEDGASGDEEDNSSVVQERPIPSAAEAIDHIQGLDVEAAIAHLAGGGKLSMAAVSSVFVGPLVGSVAAEHNLQTSTAGTNHGTKRTDRAQERSQLHLTPLALPAAEHRCGSQLHLASRVTPSHRTVCDHSTDMNSGGPPAQIEAVGEEVAEEVVNVWWEIRPGKSRENPTMTYAVEGPFDVQHHEPHLGLGSERVSQLPCWQPHRSGFTTLLPIGTR